MNNAHGTSYTLGQFLTDLENGGISGYVHKHAQAKSNGQVTLNHYKSLNS
jgi:hypothetical protein